MFKKKIYISKTSKLNYIYNLISKNIYLAKEHGFSYNLIEKNKNEYYINYSKESIHFLFKVSFSKKIIIYNNAKLDVYYALYKSEKIPLNLDYKNNIYSLDNGEMDCRDYRCISSNEGLIERVSYFVPSYIEYFKNILKRNYIMEIKINKNIELINLALINNKYKLDYLFAYKFDQTLYQVIINKTKELDDIITTDNSYIFYNGEIIGEYKIIN